MAATAEPVVVPPGGGRSLFGGRVVFKIDEADTQGAFSVHEASVPPGAVGARPHVHEHADEAMYVLAGVLAVELGDQAVRAPAGAFILIPRGVVHAYSNPGTETARFLGILSPAATVAARARRGLVA